MITTLNASLPTKDGILLVGELIHRNEFDSFKIHTQKDIQADITILGRDYEPLKPLYMRRLGLGSCVRISTESGFDITVPENKVLMSASGSFTTAYSLKVGDSFLMSGNYDDVPDYIKIRVSEDFSDMGYIEINEMFSSILAAIHVFGLVTSTTIVLKKVPDSVISLEAINYLKSIGSTVLTINREGKEYHTIRISNSYFVTLATMLLDATNKETLPIFLNKSPKSVIVAFMLTVFNQGWTFNTYSNTPMYLQAVQLLLFRRLGIYSKITASQSYLDFGSTVQELKDKLRSIVLEKKAIQDINPAWTSQIYKKSEFNQFVVDKVVKIDIVQRELIDLVFDEDVDVSAQDNIFMQECV